MIVIDASAVIEMLIEGPKASLVKALYMSEQSHAPDLISFEVLSGIRGNIRGGKLTPQQAQVAMLDFEDIEANLELWPLLDVMTEQAIAMRENVSAYDACYATLAKIFPCALVTADAKLGRAVEDIVDVIVV